MESSNELDVDNYNHIVTALTVCKHFKTTSAAFTIAFLHFLITTRLIALLYWQAELNLWDKIFAFRQTHIS